MLDCFFLAAGIAIAGYFIGEGLKNFQNPEAKGIFDEEDDLHELIKEKDVWYYIGTTKEDAKSLLTEYPDVPHITLNNNIYYQKSKLKKWLLEINGNQPTK